MSPIWIDDLTEDEQVLFHRLRLRLPTADQGKLDALVEALIGRLGDAQESEHRLRSGQRRAIRRRRALD